MPSSHPLLSSSSSSCSSFFFFFFFFISMSLPATSAQDNATTCPSAPFMPHIVSSPAHAQLKVLVPNISAASFRQLVDCSDPSNVRGFCIDVFQTALSILPHNYSSSSVTISYTCFDFSANPNDTNQTLTYNDMIGAVVNGSYDVVVGDVTIAAQRAYKLDFTQPFMESGIVIITKTTNDGIMFEWLLFGLPFAWRMWFVVVGAFALTGFILWLLEHESNHELNEGSLPSRINKVSWFIMEALVLLQRESIHSSAGQLIMVAWLFIVFLLAASYTAGLSSLLTAQNLSPTIVDIPTLQDTNKSISYREGSITKDFLTTRFHVQERQLRPTRSNADFINNITKGPSSGGVIAIVDELPYANIMLANLSCDFGIRGSPLTSEGFGFGFRHGLQDWVKQVSIALLNITESGCLEDIQKKKNLIVGNKCSSTGSQSTKLSWRSLMPLFLTLFFIICSCLVTSYISKKKRNNVTIRTPIFEDDSSHLAPLRRYTNAEVELVYLT